MGYNSLNIHFGRSTHSEKWSARSPLQPYLRHFCAPPSILFCDPFIFTLHGGFVLNFFLFVIFSGRLRFSTTFSINMICFLGRISFMGAFFTTSIFFFWLFGFYSLYWGSFFPTSHSHSNVTLYVACRVALLCVYTMIFFLLHSIDSFQYSTIHLRFDFYFFFFFVYNAMIYNRIEHITLFTISGDRC